MSHAPRNRISNAIDSLITHLVPSNPNDDEQTAQERHDACFELVRTIFERPGSPSISADVNHASDLIKRKLIQSNPSQALRFSNLYTRLLSLPVLNQKWAILYLLYQLSDSPDPNEPPPAKSPAVPRGLTSREPSFRERERQDEVPREQRAPQEENFREPTSREPSFRESVAQRATVRSTVTVESKTSTPAPAPPPVSEEEAVNNVFAPGGLKKLPTERPGRNTTTEETRSQPGAGDGSTKKSARDVSIKSTLLADNSLEFEPSEMGLLRDLPFTLQGLSSTTLPFTKDTVLKLPPTLPLPIVSLLHTLAEPSLLYRGLANFVKSPAKGLLGQSLRAAINNELRSYLTLVATLEAQIRRALSSLDEAAPRGGIGKAGVTLKRCVVWTREATMGLRLMSLISEESYSKQGGQLISLIHGFSTSHGDPVVAAFAERLLADVTRPFYDILRRWIYDGELSDPHLEFFVREQNPNNEKQNEVKAKGQASVWNSKYEVVDAMVPSIMTADFAQKVFLIGKSLNFIRHSCGDSQWVDAYSKTSSKELKYGDTATLEKWIDDAYKTTMQRLMMLMNTRFRLFDHLQALKNYILLGQGDFIALLMESLAANLDRPAGAQYRHTLTAQLEHAIRGSNAQYDSDEVLRRLDARMLQLSHGDIGWDCFTLEYKIDAPVDVVVTEWGNRQYLKVFNFLWRIKRVEFALASTWRKCMTGARGVLQSNDEVVLQTWKSTRGTLAEMIHFVGQLQYYILFEVIESSWGELQKNIRKEDCTLDDLITAHTKYLTSITHKGLLGARRRQYHDLQKEAAALGRDASEVEDRNSYMVQLSLLLRNMLDYRDSVDGLYSWSVSDFTRRQEVDTASLLRKHRPNSDMENSVGGVDDPFFSGGIGDNIKSEFPVLQERLKQLGVSFRTRLQILLGDLAYQPDVDMRFLGVSMNFNDVYQPVRRKSAKAAAAGGGGTSNVGSNVGSNVSGQEKQGNVSNANVSFSASRA
ncbi:Spc98 family-domain-containing protein [Apiosordaria backusii]|uniref:Spc98 family-domain-containing protein n=1 Tax=Apiosordaria backusii TaxID=314023 RepID=A0AA40DPS7_9PEZI|nr:Spc98 family-domain-containing protein [Apiosordaria backusii]